VQASRLLEGFGDVDTSGYKAKTQFPNGMALMDADKLLVCDTLNHKVKIVQLEGKGYDVAKSSTLMGNGVAGDKIPSVPDSSNGNNELNSAILKNVGLSHPQGVTYSRTDRKIYIADTGNDRLLVVDRDTSRISELRLTF
jgi:sugar lactone lactonase YvrE